jgi:hypothetical protein
VTLLSTHRTLHPDGRHQWRDDTATIGDHEPMPPRAIPESTKASLHQRLLIHARQRWPALADVGMRFRGHFAYIDGELATGEVLPLCRLLAALLGLGQPVGVCDLPGQPRRLRRQPAAERPAERRAPGGAGLRLRAVPQRPHCLAAAPPTSQLVTAWSDLE